MVERLWTWLDLSHDQAHTDQIDAEVRAGVEFRGTTIWLLVCAIVIASVGLNVNSTAVIIGAMLVSPLMGPIQGVGYAVAVSDLTLLRVALANLAGATAVALAASAAYFALSPLTEPQSELFARTNPTIFDVVIAMFGGFAGIVGATRRERSNVIPGVAIATALMPPLCTAGFGVARGDLAFFAGAFYLFVINCVFIALATWAMVRVMRIPEISHANAIAARRAHRGMLLVGVLTALPSVYFAEQLVSEIVLRARVERFVGEALQDQDGWVVVGTKVDAANHHFTATVLGDHVGDERLAELRARLPEFGLDGVAFELRQSAESELDVTRTTQAVAQAALPQLVARLEDAQAKLAAREQDADAEVARRHSLQSIEAELLAQIEGATEAIVAATVGTDGTERLLVALTTPKPLPPADHARLTRWLAVRTEGAAVSLFDRRPPPTVTEGDAPETKHRARSAHRDPDGTP